MPGFDYSKWDNLELSDDEDHHPGAQFIEANTLRRIKREAHENKEKERAEKIESLEKQIRKNERKIKELFISFWLETHYTKKELLKLYFDRAYLGGGSYGVEAAAQYYFDKSVRDLNLAEAALLAGMFKAPTRYAPHINLALSRARTNEVLTNMVEVGLIYKFYDELSAAGGADGAGEGYQRL